ncbi:MAG TPA: DegT/DnrJ/EryC1/StrS family aminotransferase [Candidatus Peribacteraceae bacterium]|nr:DegT/DnrJ/EryC1/StrS family aminotransferase [Candidatus Peribacteraceae bacterium]
MKVPLIKSGFYREQETRDALAEFVRTTQRFSMSEACAAFEDAFAKYQKRKHALFVSSGSMANIVLLQALLNTNRLKHGDRVGFSALTWATNVMPIIQLGLVPVPLDCSIDTLNVMSGAIDAIDDLQAVFLTNVLGFCGDLDTIRDRCRGRNILLLEDNCESLGSVLHGELLGNFGLASTFSFFVGHHLSTIEGGMICTDDDALYDMLVMTRAHGWDRNLHASARDKLRSEHAIDSFYDRYTFYDLAYNARPTELQGFLGNRQLPFLPEMISKRVSNFLRFQSAVSSRPDLYRPLAVSHMETVSNFAMPVVCTDESIAAVTRKLFEDAGVEIRPVIAGDMTRQPFYAKYCEPVYCPNADKVHQCGFYFGNNPEMTEEEIDLLCNLLTDRG